MALNSCSSLGYVYERHLCLPVTVDARQEEFTYDAAWIAGAFFLGLVLGVVIVLLLAKYCLYIRKRKQEQLNVSQTTQAKIIETQAVNGLVSAGGREIVLNNKKGAISQLQFWRRKKPVLQTSEENIMQYKQEPAVIHGMADIILQPSKCMSEVEMAEQDMVSILSMERSKDEDVSTLMQHILTILLRKQMKERAITKNFFHNFIRKIQEDIEDMNKIIDIEREEAKQKLRNDLKFSKDALTLETELQKLQTAYNTKHNKLQMDLRNKIRQDLMRSSGLKDNEINDLMAELTSSMAVVEDKIGQEQERQRRALEIRLARRRQVVEYMEIEAMENEQDKNAHAEIVRNLLPREINGNHRLKSHTDDIVNNFASEPDRMIKYQPSEFHLLQQSRLHNFEKLCKNQDKEKAELLQTSQQAKNATDFVQRYHDMVTKHHQETEVFWEKQDQREVEEIFKIKQEFIQRERIDIDDGAEKLADKLRSEMTSLEITRILKLYRAEMKKYESEKQKEKQAALARLQERLQQRLKTADFNQKQQQIGQEILMKEQMATVRKVVTMNIDLTEADKDQILKEHQQNMKTLSNQLLCSKLRQQKSLEIKLNQRKLHLESLLLRKKNIQKSNKQDKDGQLSQLTADITKEEQLLEEARQAAVAELRKQLANETEEALKLQTDSLSLLIGRLQLCEVRKKMILARQEGTLQHALDITLASTEPVTPEMEDILKQHSDNITHLEMELQRQKKEKENTIKEKVITKRQRLQQQIESQLEEEAQYEFTAQQQKGVSYASLALIQLLHKQKHKKRMQELNAKMTAELEKCRSDLNLEFEQNLKKGLEAQMQDFLAKMAAISKMSKKELQSALSAITSG